MNESELIALLAREGSRDSSGVFSIDTVLARRKVGELARLTPAALVGKLVQAAVAGEASEIRFRLGHEVLAHINFPSHVKNIGSVRRYLALAFGVAEALEPGRVEWEVGGRPGAPEEAAGQCVFRFNNRPDGLWGRLRNITRRRCNFHSLLYQRAFLCAIPLYVDNVLINRGELAWRESGCERMRLVPDSQEHFLCPALEDLRATEVRFGDHSIRGARAFGQDRLTRRLQLEGVERPKVNHRLISKTSVAASPDHPILCNSTREDRLWNSVHECNMLNQTVLEQWEWSGGRDYLIPWSGKPYLTLSDRWLSTGPGSQASLFWPVRDGLLMHPIELKQAPPGGRVIQVVTGMQLDFEQQTLVRDSAFVRLEEELTQLLREMSGP